MTPSARVQAAIEILDLVIAEAARGGAPADRVVSEWFRSRRFAGSKDRRAVREHVYAAIRACGPVPVSGRAAMLRLVAAEPDLSALFDGSVHAPQPIAPDEPVAEGGVAPDWLETALSASDVTGEAARALLDRAPLDVRINTLKPATLSDLPEGSAPGPAGLRYPHGTRIEDSAAYLGGRIEVQDAGSQLTCMAVDAQAGETVLDLCAGAGGKTLALAAAVGPSGRVIASDIDRTRLSRLAPRAERAGAQGIVETRLLNPDREAEALIDLAEACDAVMVDAPCSGTGTWRRNPEARWRLTPAQLARYVETQARLLDLAARFVAPAGRLVFVTCSLLDAEGAGEAEAFLARHPEWKAVPVLPGHGESRGGGLRLSPLHDGTDGFFVARFERLC